MHITKLTNVTNSSIDELLKPITKQRVFLEQQPDTFVKSGSKQKEKKNEFIDKLLETVDLVKKSVKQNKQAAYYSPELVEKIAKKYPNLELSDIQNFMLKACEADENPKKVMAMLEKGAKELSGTYKENVDKIRANCDNAFGAMESVASVNARSKGENSVLSKLITKYCKGKLTSSQIGELARAIGDGYGARIVLNDMDPEKSKKIIYQVLRGQMSYEDFVKKTLNMDYLDKDEKKIVRKCLDKLKEAQSNEFVDKFVKLIKKGGIELADDEFNNYGSEITSYFSDAQLLRIAHAYEQKTGKPLTVVNKVDLNSMLKRVNVKADTKKAFVDTNPDKALKASGYTSTQANIKTKYTTGEALADMEMQVRGKHVNDFAEIEHVPYDIRQGKKTAPEYDEIRNVMRGMSEESYREYSKYLSDTYTYHRLNELGVPIEKPVLSKNLKWADVDKLPEDLKNTVKAGDKIDSDLISKITEQGLLSLHSK